MTADPGERELDPDGWPVGMTREQILAEMGITEEQARRFERVAAMSKAEFNAEVERRRRRLEEAGNDVAALFLECRFERGQLVEDDLAVSDEDLTAIAIHPDSLRGLVRDAIEQHIDHGQLGALRREERAARETLEELAQGGFG